MTAVSAGPGASQPVRPVVPPCRPDDDRPGWEPAPAHPAHVPSQDEYWQVTARHPLAVDRVEAAQRVTGHDEPVRPRSSATLSKPSPAHHRPRPLLPRHGLRTGSRRARPKSSPSSPRACPTPRSRNAWSSKPRSRDVAERIVRGAKPRNSPRAEGSAVHVGAATRHAPGTRIRRACLRAMGVWQFQARRGNSAKLSLVFRVLESASPCPGAARS
jgi:hypothetical protein